MPTAEPRRTPQEISRLGHEVYDRSVLPLLSPADNDKFVAVDIDTGDYEVDPDDYSVIMRLRKRRPSADIWLGRVGHRTAIKMR